MSLDSLTPADKCGIKIEGENKWLTLIQNAALPFSMPQDGSYNN